MQINRSSYLKTVKVFNPNTKCKYCQCVFTIEPEDKFEEAILLGETYGILKITLGCPDCKKKIVVCIPDWSWCTEDEDIQNLEGYADYLEDKKKLEEDERKKARKNRRGKKASENIQKSDDLNWICRGWKTD